MPAELILHPAAWGQLEAVLQRLAGEAPSAGVIELCGLAGSGKTTLLRQVEHRARALGLPVVWRSLPLPATAAAGEDPGAGAAILAALRPEVEACLRQQGRAVLLLDDVDPADAFQLEQLMALLPPQGRPAPLLVVLTAGRPLSWSWEWVLLSQSRQVLTLPPLEAAGSAALLEAVAPRLAPEARALALAWADGYPLALVVLAEALRDGTLDPRQPADRVRLLEQLTERVLRQGVLGALPPAERPAAETLLRLLAVPHRFTALLLHELVEQFAPELAPAQPLHSLWWLQRLKAATQAFRWVQEGVRVGYRMEPPLRHLLQALWQDEAPDRWQEIQRWLVEFWSRRARQGQPQERVGALLEWSLARLQLAAPAARVQESQALLAELAAWPWRDSAARQQAVAALGQDQELLTTLGAAAATWQAGLASLEAAPRTPPPPPGEASPPPEPAPREEETDTP
uniref:Uncharacterized protein n=1 Tax=Thermogemmatispora argillosa TaxID=2045280 RepID=A0A455T4C9_9CHLR|nr:hypothetical protein KTA_04530 [Thermogemmatispora argillosa]